MDFSKDPPRLSPSIDQLKAYKDFFFPAPLLWDEQNTYEDWEEWASCYVLAEFLKTR
ncbi:hypothetical protein FRC03_003749 [Tulasnella sp. 419]|nr:hypothetical protein FRC03_003749 [Tulasnella sp. 419]